MPKPLGPFKLNISLEEWLYKFRCGTEDIEYSEQWGFYIIVENDEAYNASRINLPKQYCEEAARLVCSTCHGSGEVASMDYVYPGEPHMADIGDNRPCPELPHAIIKYEHIRQ